MPIIAAMLVISHMTSHKISLCSGGISAVHQSENNCYHIDIHPNRTDEWKFWINKNNGNIEIFGHKNNMDIYIYIIEIIILKKGRLYLVRGMPTPLKNMKDSWDDYS